MCALNGKAQNKINLWRATQAINTGTPELIAAANCHAFCYNADTAAPSWRRVASTGDGANKCLPDGQSRPYMLQQSDYLSNKAGQSKYTRMVLAEQENNAVS